jgi:hypothetical protein
MWIPTVEKREQIFRRVIFWLVYIVGVTVICLLSMKSFDFIGQLLMSDINPASVVIGWIAGTIGLIITLKSELEWWIMLRHDKNAWLQKHQ